MTKNQKIIAWFSIVGAGLAAGIATAANFFPELKTVLAASGTLIGAVVAFVVTKNKE